MTYFTSDILAPLIEHQDVDMLAPEQVDAITARLCELHEGILANLQQQSIGLHTWNEERCVPWIGTAGTVDPHQSIVMPYLRHKTQAVTVERLLGREEVATHKTIEVRRHPVIEVRLSPDWFAIELLMSPDAWWDQQNLVGKLSIARHRQAIYSLLKALDAGYNLGFWRGEHLSEMHLTAAQFQHPRVMDEWMSTFEPGSDWFRLGIWYDYEDDALSEATIAETIWRHLRLLYPLYEQFLWTSDNNFRDFYLNPVSR